MSTPDDDTARLDASGVLCSIVPARSNRNSPPHRYASRSFSAANYQSPIPDDDTARLDTSGVLRVHRVVVCILYYARAIDSPLLPALTEIGSEQAKATKETLDAMKNS